MALLVLAAIPVLTASVAAAASKNTVQISAPAKVAGHKVLKTTIYGHAAGKLRLAYFAAYRKCASNALAESRLAFGTFTDRVSGSYTHVVLTPKLDHSGFLCAYLESGGANHAGIPTGTVVAHAAKAFKTT
jgi:hypothetical protein